MVGKSKSAKSRTNTSVKKKSAKKKVAKKKATKKKVAKKTPKKSTNKKVAKKTPKKSTNKKVAKKTSKKSTKKKVAKKKATNKKVAKKTPKKSTNKKVAKKTSKKAINKKVAKKKATNKKVAKKTPKKSTNKKVAKKTSKKSTNKKVAKKTPKKSTNKKVAKKKSTNKKVAKKKSTNKKVAKKTAKKSTNKKVAKKKPAAIAAQVIDGDEVLLEVPKAQLHLPEVATDPPEDVPDLLHQLKLYARFGPEAIAGDVETLLQQLDGVNDPSLMPQLFAMLEDQDPHGIYWHVLYVLENFDDAYLRGLLEAFPSLWCRSPQWACTCVIRILNTRGDEEDCTERFNKLAAHAPGQTQAMLLLALQLLLSETEAGWSQEQVESLEATIEVLDQDTLPLFPEPE